MSGYACEGHPGCITCGDEGIPMRVVEQGEGVALCVDGEGRRHEVAVDLIERAAVGDRILVHAGVAIGELARA